MIVIQDDVWRSECVARIGIDGSTVDITAVNSDETWEYDFDTAQEAKMVFINAVNAWKKDLGK